MGWIYMTRFDHLEAVHQFKNDLQSFAIALGAPKKYHETITLFFLSVIADRLSSTTPVDATSKSWETFKAANEDLLLTSGDFLSTWYSKEVLRSNRARKDWVEPDRKALTFKLIR